MSTLDARKNFSIAQVSIGYSSSDTTIVLTTGQGARFPAPLTEGAFNLVWWNSTDYTNPSDDPNVEIVRCTARSSDTLTVTRAQEGTLASAKNTAVKVYKMILAPTKKMIDDIEAALDSISSYEDTVSGVIDGVNQTFVFVTAPNVLGVDEGRVIRRVRKNGDENWTASTLPGGNTQIVLAVAPELDIFKIA